MAGAGSRFLSAGISLPKPLIKVFNKTLIEYSIESFNVPARYIFITREFDDPLHNVELSKTLKSLLPNSIEIRVKNITSGATQTALAASDLLDNDQPLVIYNCDQLLRWNPIDFMDFIKKRNPEAALVLYNSRDPKNSFAEINNGSVTRVVEKDPISSHALVGFHYWAHGRDFVYSAKKLMESFVINGKPECYISETFNYLKNKEIIPYHISPNLYVPLGTPADVAKFVGKTKEFLSNKPKTIFIDLDGTMVKHMHAISEVYFNDVTLLPGVREKLNEWDSQGHKIVLVTARKESVRELTVSQLNALGIAYDQLVMGVSTGTRLMINDKLNAEDPNRAEAINVLTDAGFNSISWEDYDL